MPNKTRIGLLAQLGMIADAMADDNGVMLSVLLTGAALAIQRLRVVGGSYISATDIDTVEAEISGLFLNGQPEQEQALPPSPASIEDDGVIQ